MGVQLTSSMSSRLHHRFDWSENSFTMRPPSISRTYMKGLAPERGWLQTRFTHGSDALQAPVSALQKRAE
jgi:hypothetical protein